MNLQSTLKSLGISQACKGAMPAWAQCSRFNSEAKTSFLPPMKETVNQQCVRRFMQVPKDSSQIFIHEALLV
eukprot:scaffold385166_cov20-Prasinocladus_malaysianus.AAC.1